MKLYEKIIDGQRHCKPASKIIIIKDDMQTFNPTEEMLFEDGWTVHVPEVHEPTEEELLQIEKDYLKEELIRYDSSDEINIFYVNGVDMWLDKATRTGLMLRLQSELAMELENTSLWYNELEFILPVKDAMQMLYAIEIYASKCYDTTQQHIATISKITSIDDVKNYNFRSNYPEHLIFTL